MSVLGKTGFVDAIVDIVVSPFIGGLDFLLEMFGEEVDFLIFLREDIIEFGVEHADDFAGLKRGEQNILAILSSSPMA